MHFKRKELGVSDKSLPNWVKVDKKRFDRIKNQIKNVKNNNLQAIPEHISTNQWIIQTNLRHRAQ